MLAKLEKLLVVSPKLSITVIVLAMLELIFLPTAYFSSPLINLPVKLDSSATVRKRFFVSVPDHYTLYLSFDLRDRDADIKLIESEGCNIWDNPGVKNKCPEVKWFIAANGFSAPELASGVGFSGHGVGLSSDEYSIALGETPICFGPYFISAQILSGNTALQRLNPRLKLKSHSKLIYTWERLIYSIILLGQIIIVPILLISISVLNDKLKSRK